MDSTPILPSPIQLAPCPFTSLPSAIHPTITPSCRAAPLTTAGIVVARDRTRLCYNALMTLLATQYRYIVRNPAIAAGRPTIKETRIRVAQIAIEYERLAWSPDEIVEAHPHLSLSQVHNALAFYYDHQKEIDEDIAESERFAAELARKYPSKLNSCHATSSIGGCNVASEQYGGGQSVSVKRAIAMYR